MAALLVTALLATSAAAQPPAATPPDSLAADSVTVRLPGATAPGDSVFRPLPAPPRAAADGDTVGFFGSPTGIMLRSLAVPGWGQAVNGSWLKAGIAVAAEGTLVYLLVRDSQRLGDLSAADPEYDRVWNRRQQTAWWLGAAIFLSMVDAYVDAHLGGSDVELGPEPRSDALLLGVRVRWP